MVHGEVVGVKVIPSALAMVGLGQHLHPGGRQTTSPEPLVKGFGQAASGKRDPIQLLGRRIQLDGHRHLRRRASGRGRPVVLPGGEPAGPIPDLAEPAEHIRWRQPGQIPQAPQSEAVQDVGEIRLLQDGKGKGGEKGWCGTDVDHMGASSSGLAVAGGQSRRERAVGHTDAAFRAPG